jgi:hypothetical protein
VPKQVTIELREALFPNPNNTTRVVSPCFFIAISSIRIEVRALGRGNPMRFLLVAVAIIWQVSGLTSHARCQEPDAEGRLHFTFGFPGGFNGRYELTASTAETVHPNGKADSILQLRGNVEVRTIVCRPTGNVCDKSSLVLRADAIDFNETTGEIEAKGTVHTVLVGPWPDAKFNARK